MPSSTLELGLTLLDFRCGRLRSASVSLAVSKARVRLDLIAVRYRGGAAIAVDEADHALDLDAASSEISRLSHQVLRQSANTGATAAIGPAGDGELAVEVLQRWGLPCSSS